ncbi:MAG TPA: ABC transporter substrate-binding protein [Xanthobacteraceae bacterium]|nr:ABC transporter substrate-binding protein [Xanthobacteraceae bacterium]
MWVGAAVAAAMAVGVGRAAAEDVKFANIGELSGAGAVSSINWRDGATLAIEEINAQGGLLGRRIALTNYDDQTNPGMARAQMQKAIDEDPYVILGPIFSGMVKVSMMLAQQAEIPQFIGGEAADLTQLGDPYLFRTSLGQQDSMPKIANYIRDVVKAKSVALVWVNNDFGKGGRDNFINAMKARGIAIVADISTESGQTDFAADVVKAKAANADAIFVYTNEEESARFLREVRKQGVAVPLIGETTLLNQKVIELAGDAANGVRGHVGLSADIPTPAVREFKAKFLKRFNYAPDHNAIKGYTAVYAIRFVTEKKLGKFDGKALAAAMHGLTISPSEEPGILIETSWDDKGDVDRVSFLAEVVDGKQQITETLPKLGK